MDTTKRLYFVQVAGPCLAVLLWAGELAAGPATEKDRQAVARGRELFRRDWLPGDRRSHAGDGLGPLYNARSCAACHHQGGEGGAGPRHMNVTLANAFLEAPPLGFWARLWGAKPKPPQQPKRSELAKIHPGLRTSNSFTLHRFGTDKGYVKWKQEFLGGPPVTGEGELADFAITLETRGNFSITRDVGTATLQLVLSQRNAPSLFGVGAIERIPDRVLEKVAAEQARAAASPDGDFPPVSGRVARLRDGRIGRFGWKAQTATLRDFTLQACAVELGLEVPGFAQSAPPWVAGYKARGLDLTAEQCNALIAFVGSLPPPAARAPETPQHAAEIAAGQKLFEKIGCAECHRPKLGDVAGIYSDLLIHDMGEALADTGSYGAATTVAGKDPGDGVEPLPVVSESGPDNRRAKAPRFGAAPREWRTPPLWGLRDSAPYLHDGRAETLSDAIVQHGGEGADAAQRFARLGFRERQQLELFLEALPLPAR
jgi:CxxC motif-containing protein (DUF1111 family)